MIKLVNVVSLFMLVLVIVPAHAKQTQYVTLPEVVRCSEFANGSQLLFLSCIEEQLGDDKDEQIDDYDADNEVLDDYGS